MALLAIRAQFDYAQDAENRRLTRQPTYGQIKPFHSPVLSVHPLWLIRLQRPHHRKTVYMHLRGTLMKRSVIRLRTSTTALLLPVLAALTLSSQGAQAADTDTLSMESYVRPINAEPLDLSALQSASGQQKLQGLRTQQAPEALLPNEVVGPARSYAPHAAEASAQPSATERADVSSLAATVSLPEPAHSMTKEECVLGLGTQQFFVKSRYAVCSGKQFDQVWLRNGEPVGTSHFDVLGIGTIPKNSRVMTVNYYYTDFARVGTNAAPALGITTKGSIAQSWPSTAKYTHGGTTMPVTKKWAELLAGKPITHTVSVPSSEKGSNGATNNISAVYISNIKLVSPPGWTANAFTGGDLFMLPPRWDKAPYLSSAATGAAVFSVTTALQYSTAATAPEREVALHIKKAFTKPGSTQPPSSKKHVPGQTADAPLTRLYSDTKRRDQNRNRSVYNCQKYFGTGYTQNGTKECDEYPMATTYEGAVWSDYDPRAEPNNFSVLPVAKASNRDAGILLGQFYDKNRIIDGPDDGFLVKILP
ncbi:hypothetical protein [Streptomyces sp. NPDC087294]|uniref:NucA/NucB deoxyribonuclease domain-containing protein n=1 Tax=Streptomyces sp. NPDC087294 TaxID=3365777 RepID=UPI0038276AAF